MSHPESLILELKFPENGPKIHIRRPGNIVLNPEMNRGNSRARLPDLIQSLPVRDLQVTQTGMVPAKEDPHVKKKY
jgi:hypothetical protein